MPSQLLPVAYYACSPIVGSQDDASWGLSLGLHLSVTDEPCCPARDEVGTGKATRVAR